MLASVRSNNDCCWQQWWLDIIAAASSGGLQWLLLASMMAYSDCRWQQWWLAMMAVGSSVCWWWQQPSSRRHLAPDTRGRLPVCSDGWRWRLLAAAHLPETRLAACWHLARHDIWTSFSATQEEGGGRAKSIGRNKLYKQNTQMSSLKKK